MDSYDRVKTKYGKAIISLKKATSIRKIVPSEVSSEIDNALSHIVIHFSKYGAENYKADGEKSSDMEKAEGHLERARLDACKVIWLEYWSIFSKILSHPLRGRIRFGKDWKGLQTRIRKGMNELYKMSLETRATETRNIGSRIDDSIENWEKIIKSVEDIVFPDDNDMSESVFSAYGSYSRTSAFLDKWTPESITFVAGLTVSFLSLISIRLFS